MTISLTEAATRLPELIHVASNGEEVLLMQDERPVARLVSLPVRGRPRCPGSAKGILLHIAEDFDATPEGFEEYMP